MTSILFAYNRFTMVRTSKLKFFSFKTKKHQNTQCLEDASQSKIISENELPDLENIPVKFDDVLKTPKMRIDSPLEVSPCSVSDTQQFKVGWDDGSDNPELDSPHYVPPVSRKIRRCPDNLLNRLSKVSTNEAVKRSCENDYDVLECVSWAKNLLNDDLCNENEKNMQTENILDDSTDELMVLCSQAVEENILPSHFTKRFKLDPNDIEDQSLKNISFHSDKSVVSTNMPKPRTFLPRTDSFESYLDDNEEFSTFDLSYLDAIQTKLSASDEPNSRQDLPVPKPVRYSKEEIEKRRLEAKKKLLFRRKNKSM